MLPAHAISMKNVAEKQFLEFHQVHQQKLIEMLKKSLVNLCTCLKPGPVIIQANSKLASEK